LGNEPSVVINVPGLTNLKADVSDEDPDLNLGILHKLDAGQNRVPEGGRAEVVHGKSRVYTP
jgi:hypothetical protein